MADLLDTLRQLQALDAQLYRLRHEQQQKPLALERMKQEVAEEHAKAQAIEAHFKTVSIQQREKDLDLSTREAHIKKLQLQLFQVKTNKEYTIMQHEIEQSKADLSLLEEEIIRLLEAIDRTRQEHQAQLDCVTHQQALYAQEEARVTQELTVIDEQRAQFERQRQTLTPLVQRESLVLYERVLANRDGMALVPLIEESCGGCHMVQPPQVLNEVYRKAKLVTCENCSRILYLDETQSPAPSE